MLSKFLCLVFFVFFSCQVWANPWQNYYGCYETTHHNDLPVASGPQNLSLVAYSPESFLFTDPKGGELKSNVLFLFKEKIGENVVYAYHDALVENSQQSSTQTQLWHQVSEIVLTKGDSPLLLEYTGDLHIEALDNELRVRSYVKLKLPNSDQYVEENDTFRLKSRSCNKFVLRNIDIELKQLIERL